MELGFKEYFGTDHVFSVSSGKAALYLILIALMHLRNRAKVIIPAYTCYSVPSAVLKAGLKIVLCDIRTETMDFDYEALKPLLDDDTLCIIPTHLFGIPSVVDNIKNICEEKGIYIVEDAAQAMGVTLGEKKLGTLGDVAFFSLGRGKNITCGSGGIIVTYSEEIATVLRKLYGDLDREPAREYLINIFSVILMNIFINPCLYWFPKGLPFLKIGETKFYKDFPVFRLNAFKAGLLRRWREILGAYNHGRSETGDYYRKGLKLENTLPIYSLPVPYLRFPVYGRMNQVKDNVYEHYRDFGITRMYPDSVNKIEEIKDSFNGTSYRNSETIAKTLFTLPTHSLLSDQDKMNICKIARNLMNELPTHG